LRERKARTTLIPMPRKRKWGGVRERTQPGAAEKGGRGEGGVRRRGCGVEGGGSSTGKGVDTALAGGKQGRAWRGGSGTGETVHGPRLMAAAGPYWAGWKGLAQ
jgi:hypothetical protein